MHHRRLCTARGVAILTALVAFVSLAAAVPAVAAPGSVVADFATEDGKGGVGVAFDGHELYYTDANGLVLHRMATNGAKKPDIPVLGATGIKTLAYDVTHDWFWGVDATGLGVYIIQKDGLARLRFVIEPVLHLPGLCKSLTGCSTLVTGFAYDAQTDSLWYAPEGSPRVYHFNTVGDLLGYFDVDTGASALSPDCMTNRAYGLAAGKTELYVTAGGCGNVFRYSKSDENTATKLGWLAQPGPKAADAECDDLSFTVHVVWVHDSVDGNIRALEIPPGTCYYGGGVKLNTELRWMTGGGQLSFETPPNPETGEVGTLPLWHGFRLNCDIPETEPAEQPNNLSVTWKDPDGNAHRFHMTLVTNTTCVNTGDPTPPYATFNRIQGHGVGRLDGRKDAGAVDFFLSDNGEPSSADTGSISIVDVSNPAEPVTVVIGCLECVGKGNHQAHR